MDRIRYPVIGIPKWWWKSKVLRFAKANPYIITANTGGLGYECSRHLELLSLFDDGITDYQQTEYFRYHRGNKKNNKSINRKIEKFKNLYNDIKDKGCLVPPVITDDGCRIDGSHRIAILIHLGIKETAINLVKYENVFDRKRAIEIREDNIKYRQNHYGFKE